MPVSRRDFFSASSLMLLTSVAGSSSAAENRQATVSKLLGAALTDTGGFEKLVYLCDRIGHRLAGSASLARAIEWCAATMKEEGLQNVATPLVRVPVWVRGNESIRLLEPGEREMPMLGLGGSVGTPPDGIRGEVLVVGSFEELEAKRNEDVAGKVVLFNAPFTSYGATVRYRISGASRAAEKGAVACLIRSITPVSLQSPHTGAMRYDVDGRRIPAAALTIEDAERLARLAAVGLRIRVELKMEARSEPDADSANVIGEIPGREPGSGIVVMGGHIDSWDVGQGAQDDGVGCMAALQALAIVSKLGLRPRRTLRVCLWTNEENGLRGGNAYRQWSEDRGEKHVAAIEMDGGCERPDGFGLGLRLKDNDPEVAWDLAFSRLRPVAEALSGIGAGQITRGGGGADIGPLMNAGVPGLGLRTVGEKYFHWHHSHADTVDKVDRDDFRKCIGALAVMGYLLADMEATLLQPSASHSPA